VRCCAICEEPPRRPTQPAASAGRLDADLEAILLKALRKDPKERYRSAEQLASDISAWLEERPVAARRGTLRYRAQKFIRRHRLALAGAVLLSELDEAIKDLPGSTGAQKLLVTRVLEHLDRMATDAQGDRQSKLDLVDAYTRLGNIQGNPYEQNLGDPAGALASISKAMALAEPWVRSNPQDRVALRAWTTAQEGRGEVLSETGNPQDTVAAMQASVKSYDRLISLPGTDPNWLLEASRVNETLGDVVGEDIGLADVAGAIVAYRKSADMDRHAVEVDPKSMRARRALTNMQFKIGNAELDIDPSQALVDLRMALHSYDAFPAEDRAKLSNVRLRALIVRKQAVAFSELGAVLAGRPAVR
jgi:tetratricopeptide (TPR) repeat protein